MSDLHVYDTTLRDGAQQEGLNLSVADKLAIAAAARRPRRRLHRGRLAGRQPQGHRVLRRARGRAATCGTRTLAAFGATRRAGAQAADDPLVAALRDSGAPVVTLVAKSHDRHVELALRTTLEENLAMVRDTVAHLRAEGQRVFLDAEHFFDGYRANRDYALEVLRTAAEAGAEVVALCDTNGGMLPPQVGDVVARRRSPRPARGSASTATTTPAARSPTRWPRSTPAPPTCRAPLNGYGERTGNADLFTRRRQPGAQAGPRRCCPTAGSREATRIAHAISEVTNVAAVHPPAVRRRLSAFAHKAGLHASAIKVDPDLYQHIDPARRRQRHAACWSPTWPAARRIELKGRELGFDLSGDTDELLAPGHRPGQGAGGAGYTFEAADASFELLLREEVEGARPRTSRSSPGGSSPSRRRGGEALSARPRSSCAPAASGSSPPARATARSTRSTTRCAQALDAGLPGARQARADRLQGAHPRRGATAPTRSPGC